MSIVEDYAIVIDALTQLENTRHAYKQGIPVAAFLQLYRHNKRDIIRFWSRPCFDLGS